MKRVRRSRYEPRRDQSRGRLLQQNNAPGWRYVVLVGGEEDGLTGGRKGLHLSGVEGGELVVGEGCQGRHGRQLLEPFLGDCWEKITVNLIYI